MNVRAVDSHGADLPKTVLVVEDEILIRLLIAEHLTDCGYRVIEAGSGDEAVEVLRRTVPTVNVVVSDVVMPGSIDGFALAQWVRKQRPDIKGYSDIRDRKDRRCRGRIVLRNSRDPETI